MRAFSRQWRAIGKLMARGEGQSLGPCSSRRFGVQRVEGPGLRWARLESRALVRVQGHEAHSFLQGLLTNDTSFLLPGHQALPALPAFLLNTGGRVVDDVIVYNCGEEGGGGDLLLECSRDNYPTLVSTLTKYRMRKKIDLHNCSQSLSILVVFPNCESLLEPPTEDEGLLPGTISAALMKENRGPVVAVEDPRLRSLGSRTIIPSDEEAEHFVPIHRDFQSSEDNYRLTRYALGVAEGPPEIISGKSLPLECNGDYLNKISFHKGCYIGQELTARTHHAGVVRKRMMPILFDSIQIEQIPFDSKIVDPSDKVVGRVRGVERNFGIAVMRVEGALASSSKLFVSVEGEGSARRIPCRTWTPHWWNQAEEIGKIRGFNPNPAPDSN